MKQGSLVIIHFENTIMSGNDFIPPMGTVDRILNDATRDTSYLVNGFWWSLDNLELV